MTKLIIKACTTKKEIPAWGITDGKRWFFYAYTTKLRAEQVSERFANQAQVDANISYPEPVELVDLGGERTG